jgi:glycosyltransferase involved in cell wall biosynthesis
MMDDSTHARYGVVLTHNRPALLAECLDAVAPQVDLVVVVDNASDPPAAVPLGLGNVTILYDPGQPPNLPRLWNRALDALRDTQPATISTWDVAVLCDDTTPPPGWVATVGEAMRAHGAAAASTHPITALTQPLLKTQPDTDVANRMCGWAFMLPGEQGMRGDETLHWWYCDTSIDFAARAAGGMLLAPGPVVLNLRPNDFTATVAGLSEQAGRDRHTFAAKWGHAPW